MADKPLSKNDFDIILAALGNYKGLLSRNVNTQKLGPVRKAFEEQLKQVDELYSRLS